MRPKQIFFSVIVLFFSFSGSAQDSLKKKIAHPKVSMIMFDFGANVPGGDMARRFGNSLEAGGGIMHKTASNWLFRISSHYFFGGQVKEDSIIDFLRNEEGRIVGADGFYAETRLQQRGFKLPEIKIGRMVPVKLPGANASSGFVFLLGGGIIEHKIFIIDDSRSVPQLSKQNKKGFDRLSNGFMLSQSLGYVYLHENKLINFYLMFDFVQGFTQNRREINVDTRVKDTSNRTDLLWGIKAGWIFPLYGRDIEDKFYYY